MEPTAEQMITKSDQCLGYQKALREILGHMASPGMDMPTLLTKFIEMNDAVNAEVDEMKARVQVIKSKTA